MKIYKLMKKKRVKLTVIFNEEDDEEEDASQDVYEWYYRLFTGEGIPFGDILYLQVIID